MTDVLTWTVQQRLELEERAELLRKELAGTESQLTRLEAAEVVFRQWAEATDGVRRSPGIVEPEPERVKVRVRVGCGWSRTGPRAWGWRS
ncbi:hypothetical protein [Streptomyces europaeiscabiei]|jgi:hypothetical protein|uniref:hypothetical protein n=1 Tax=Streptomyces europaeiscabiei TaxID=146819 RepID=UPI002E16DD4A